MRKYYYKKADQSCGPFTLDQLRKEKINWDTLIRFEGKSRWKSAKNIKELIPLIQTPMPSKPLIAMDIRFQEVWVTLGLILFLAYAFGAFVVGLIKTLLDPQ